MLKSTLPIIVLLLLIGCTQKEEGIKLVKDSEEYKFAKEISLNFPRLDPDINIVLVETNRF